VATTALMAVIFVFTGPGETAPATASVSASRRAEPVPGADTYPIPTHAAAELPAGAQAPTTAVPLGPTPTHRAGTDAGKGGRNHAAAHRPPAAKTPDPRAARRLGTIVATPAPVRSDAGPDAPPGGPAPAIDEPSPEPSSDEPRRDPKGGIVSGSD
jgi:hypothetical protein